MKLPSALLLSCLLLAISSVFAAKGTDSPPVQTQAPPTANNTGQCNAGYFVQGPLVGPPGRDGREGPPGREGIPGTNGRAGRDGQPGRRGQPGPPSLPGIDGADGQPGRDGKDGQPGRDGLDGKQGTPGPAGPSGLDFDELREIVHVLAMQEIKNITAKAAPPSPLRVVVECCNSTSSGIIHPTTSPKTQAPKSLQPTTSYVPRQCNNTTRPCPGLSVTDPAKSCYDIYLCDRSLPSGYYWVKRYYFYGLSYSHARVYCYMEDDKCGRGGVMRVVYMNLTENPVCPFPLKLYNASGKMVCGPTSTVATKCDSVIFPTFLIPYNFVCGKAVGYGYYQPCAFHFSTSSPYNTIDGAYLSGLSITNRKERQRQHIWSYAAGLREHSSHSCNCPCAVNPGRAAPSFVGNDFHCESGSHSTLSSQWYTSNPLWDGKGCYSGSKCCDNSRVPWFWKTLPEESTSDVEIRWCQPDGGSSGDRVGIEHLEVYVY